MDSKLSFLWKTGFMFLNSLMRKTYLYNSFHFSSRYWLQLGLAYTFRDVF